MSAPALVTGAEILALPPRGERSARGGWEEDMVLWMQRTKLRGPPFRGGCCGFLVYVGGGAMRSHCSWFGS